MNGSALPLLIRSCKDRIIAGEGKFSRVSSNLDRILQNKTEFFTLLIILIILSKHK
jgi:hypothetical protein